MVTKLEVDMASHRNKLEGKVLQVLECRDTDKKEIRDPLCCNGTGSDTNRAN